MATIPHRCGWVSDDPLYIDYHDREWGVPSHDETHLFEMLILEGAQAGLSWITILRKREHYREAFEGFDAARVARFTPGRIEKLMADPGIVRNRAKIVAAVANAKAVLKIREEAGSLAAWLWQFAGGKPVTNRWASYRDAPVATPASEAMSKALKARGCNFVGPTICQSFMQATGMVNDHEVGCFRHREVARMGK
jgi:DNA-3-methyladenine glycosylase I